MRLSIAVLLLIASVNAVAEPAPTWQKDKATQREFTTDFGQCAFQARAIYQPQRDAINARINQPTQMAGAVAIRTSPTQSAAWLMHLAAIDDQEREAVGLCMIGRGWELK